MNHLKIIPWIIVLALLLASCTNGDVNPTDNPTVPAASSPDNAAGYPYPAQGQPVITVASVNSAYPGPDNSQATPTLVPTPLTLRPPASGKANIHGILTTGANKTPDMNFLLLASAVPADKPGYAPMLSYSFDDSPRAVQDSTGMFVFFDVTPGQYGLVIASPIGGANVNDPNLNPPQAMVFTVAAGDDKDLGTINIP